MRMLGLSGLSVLAVAALGCVRSGQGFVQDSEAIVTIGGGQASIGTGAAWRAWYFVDRTSQTCWMEIGGQVECCKVRHVKEALRYIKWETDQSCASRG